MAIALHADVYIPGDSPIHRWAVRPKLLSLLGLMFAIAQITHLVLIPWVLAGVACLYSCSRLPWRYLMRRLPYPGLFVVAMVSILPWISGDTILWQGLGLALRQEGLQAAALITGRFLAIVTTGFILLGTTPFLDILKALRTLGIPPLLTDMALLTYRYLYDTATQLTTMLQAMRLRGHGFFRQTLRRRWHWLVALLGSLLLRSYERSQRVYQAMRLRGYGQPRSLAHVRVRRSLSGLTYVATSLTLGTAVSLVVAEWMLARS